jgi:mono/diheme cytochrome c family protein
LPVAGRLLPAVLLAGAVLTAPATSLARGEHARRAAAELLVMAGDARRALQQAVPPLQGKGLRDRLRGGVAALELLLRLADEELGRGPRSHAPEIGRLRDALASGALDGFAAGVGRLVTAYPLRVPGILPAVATPRRLREGERLHRGLCAGCHDAPDGTVERPAYNLSDEARRLSGRELVARLLVGVRGDRVTGIANPLSDEQIASLVVFYRSADAQGAGRR